MCEREQLKQKQRIVIKVGSSTITHEETGNINFLKLEKLVRILNLAGKTTAKVIIWLAKQLEGGK